MFRVCGWGSKAMKERAWPGCRAWGLWADGLVGWWAGRPGGWWAGRQHHPQLRATALRAHTQPDPPPRCVGGSYKVQGRVALFGAHMV